MLEISAPTAHSPLQESTTHTHPLYVLVFEKKKKKKKNRRSLPAIVTESPELGERGEGRERDESYRESKSETRRRASTNGLFIYLFI